MNNDVIDSNQTSGPLGTTPEINSYFKEIAKWANFLAIVGFVMMALMIVGGIIMTFTLSSAMSDYPAELGAFGAMGGGMLGLFYIVIALIYYFPTMFLYRFAKKMKLSQKTGDQAAFSDSIKNLKSLFKFMGIFMVVMLVLYGLIFAGAAIFGIAAAF